MNTREGMQRIVEACSRGSELIPLSVLCQSLGTIRMSEPVVVNQNASTASCIDLLAQHKSGSLSIVDDEGRLVGIFTERDCVTKVWSSVADVDEVPISQFMTTEPVHEQLHATIAFALTLMSHGGFRHLPIVDEQRHPLGTVSTKDVVDYLVNQMLEGIDALTT